MQPVSIGTLVIAGTKYRCKPNQLKDLKFSDQIELEREPKNEHDPNAIACYARSGQIRFHVGYIPSKLAKHFAPMIDNGLRLSAKVRFTNYSRLEINIDLIWEKEDSAAHNVDEFCADNKED